MIDIHAHLLPGIDDGPATIEEAIALVRRCIDTGVTYAVVTPHVFPGRHENRRSTIAAEFARFRYALQRLKLPLEIGMGGEVRLSSDVLELLEHDEIPFLGEVDGYRTMLLELPDGSIPVGSDRLVRHLLDQRICPVIAHPERNKAVMESVDRIRPFVEMGCFLQLTAASVIGEFGPAALRASRQLLERGWVSAVASDTHNLKGRAPRLDAAREALRSQYGVDVADDLTLAGPGRIASVPQWVTAPA